MLPLTHPSKLLLHHKAHLRLYHQGKPPCLGTAAASPSSRACTRTAGFCQAQNPCCLSKAAASTSSSSTHAWTLGCCQVQQTAPTAQQVQCNRTPPSLALIACVQMRLITTWLQLQTKPRPSQEGQQGKVSHCIDLPAAAMVVQARCWGLT